MMYTFKSCFASQIEDFIAQKNALGFGYLESSRLLRDFDRFCLTHFPEENTLTKELCLAWATKKDTEGNNTFRNRMMPVREFARYLNRNGEAAYILPPDIARKDAPYAVHLHRGRNPGHLGCFRSLETERWFPGAAICDPSYDKADVLLRSASI